MKLALILTGGTIGSKVQEDGWIAPKGETQYEIMEKFKKQYPQQAERVQFHCFIPYIILSENLNGAYLELLIDRVQKCLEDGSYEGILICHGTDTLQYTAAILDYVFADCSTPVLLVSSNYPLEDSRANGLYNFHYAIETCSKRLQGVMVVYRNSDGRTYVHRGNRLLAHETFDDNLYSVGHRYIGMYDEQGIWESGNEPERRQTAVPYNGLAEPAGGICWLRSYPGLAYPKLQQDTRTVLLESYHSGTLGMNEALRNFAEEAGRLGIPIYLVGAVSAAEGYETMKHYADLGIRVLENEAPIAVYCRLWLELSHE